MLPLWALRPEPSTRSAWRQRAGTGVAVGDDAGTHRLLGRAVEVRDEPAAAQRDAAPRRYATAAAKAANKSPGNARSSRHVIAIGNSDSCFTYVAGPKK